ncbi:glycosyl transferase [Parapedobacter pyrenivorans]|uniref:Glycosyl transferase n=1 Tax=Parapedobacter pyrenivorans TaxID=1305674 RepID=A0A917HZU4_9SPHI|nr:sugar transferase [Parapedobacter pyrenivorans]GGG98377.1 glycosyl transferase [Parapedobacter pyrenivorans]
MDLLTDVKNERHFLTISIAYLGNRFSDELASDFFDNADITKFSQIRDLELFISNCDLLHVPELLLLEVGIETAEVKRLITSIKSNPITQGVSIILLNFSGNKNTVIEAFRPFVNDIYFYPFNVADLRERVKFILRFKHIRNEGKAYRVSVPAIHYKIPATKRLFDIVVAGLVLLFFLPIMLLIALLIKLDSKGPVFYRSKRAGTGYKVFDFYKFRSMRVNADKELDKLSALNQYATNGGSSAFIKIKNDPRVTRLGSFLRNTSLDELPQLFNVLNGDMSLVGNRPLPLYEAQELTSDDWALRFLGPAGITGLWQVTKRGRSEMSDEERRQLDNDYANHFSFWMDLKILIKTVPALFQKEAV